MSTIVRAAAATNPMTASDPANAAKGSENIRDTSPSTVRKELPTRNPLVTLSHSIASATTDPGRARTLSASRDT
jgi:hypothetical protein